MPHEARTLPTLVLYRAPERWPPVEVHSHSAQATSDRHDGFVAFTYRVGSAQTSASASAASAADAGHLSLVAVDGNAVNADGGTSTDSLRKRDIGVVRVRIVPRKSDGTACTGTCYSDASMHPREPLFHSSSTGSLSWGSLSKEQRARLEQAAQALLHAMDGVGGKGFDLASAVSAIATAPFLYGPEAATRSRIVRTGAGGRLTIAAPTVTGTSTGTGMGSGCAYAHDCNTTLVHALVHDHNAACASLASYLLCLNDGTSRTGTAGSKAVQQQECASALPSPSLASALHAPGLSISSPEWDGKPLLPNARHYPLPVAWPRIYDGSPAAQAGYDALLFHAARTHVLNKWRGTLSDLLQLLHASLSAPVGTGREAGYQQYDGLDTLSGLCNHARTQISLVDAAGDLKPETATSTSSEANEAADYPLGAICELMHKVEAARATSSSSTSAVLPALHALSIQHVA